MPSSAFKPRIAVLDDYQHVAFKFGDWSKVTTRADITVFDDTIQIDNIDALVKRLEPFEVICGMRERTKFPAELLKRLPNLKLLTTTGTRNLSLNVKAAEKEGILVAGTRYDGGQGTAEHKYVHRSHLSRYGMYTPADTIPNLVQLDAHTGRHKTSSSFS